MISYLYAALIAVGTLVIGILLGIWIRKRAAKRAEEKISTGLSRLHDEDPSFETEFNPETKQHLISGAGDIHLDVLCSKLKDKFGVEVTLTDPIVPYREKIRKPVVVEGKHKKQSGGHGQYGDVWIEFEPCDSEELVFAENVFGGSVPKNFFPAVEKGLREVWDDPLHADMFPGGYDAKLSAD